MAFGDRLKDLAKLAEGAVADHKDQIQGAVKKAGAVADERTGGKYREKIEKATSKTETLMSKLDRDEKVDAATPQKPSDGAE